MAQDVAVPATPVTASRSASGLLSSATAPSPAQSLEATIRLGAHHGFSRARLTLRPAELGSVDVVLRSSAAGVSASVVADTPVAAKLLESAGAELRRRLEEQGLQLQALTVSVAQDAPSGPGGNGQPGGAPSDRSAGTASPGEPASELPQPIRQIELGGGVLIDVLA